MKQSAYIVNGNSSNIQMGVSAGDIETKLLREDPTTKIKSIRLLGSKENIHKLKIWPEPFSLVCLGFKKAEFRNLIEKDFRVGDLIELKEWDPELIIYTGTEAIVVITHIQEGFGIPPDFGMISFQMINHNYKK